MGTLQRHHGSPAEALAAWASAQGLNGGGGGGGGHNTAHSAPMALAPVPVVPVPVMLELVRGIAEDARRILQNTFFFRSNVLHCKQLRPG